MRRYFAVLAVMVALGSMVWGIEILGADVTPASTRDIGLSCGGVLGSLEGKPSYGGEQPFPRDWIEQCKDAARNKMDWITVPATAGPLALLYLIWALFMEGRRARAEGRSTGAVPTRG
jgi:hypothetical protein